MPVATPPLAVAVFGDRLPLAIRYADLLAGPGIERGLLGPREVDRLWDRHLLNCAAVAPLLPIDAEVVDIGSGAGLPGLVLAIARPDVHVTLLEPLLRRVAFLDEAVGALGLAGVRVVRARAEEVAGTLSGNVVTARAVTALDRLIEMAGPLLPRGGLLLALKGVSAAEEVAVSGRALTRWHCAPAEVLAMGDDLTAPHATVVRVRFPARRPVARPKRRRTS